MKTLFSILCLALSIGAFSQSTGYKMTWCDRSFVDNSDVKFEMSCLNTTPMVFNENGEALNLKNYRLEFFEGDVTVQCVRSVDTKLDQSVFGILKQSTGFSKARIYDMIVTDSKGKIFRLDQSYYFTITK